MFIDLRDQYVSALKKILIIDDEEKLRSLFTRIISLEGFEVVQASDCRSGLKKLVQTDIDVVLCDIKLPDGSGVELAKAIKEKYPSTEIILLTAYGNIPDGVQDIKTEPLIISRKAMITAGLFHSCIRQVKKPHWPEGLHTWKGSWRKTLLYEYHWPV